MQVLNLIGTALIGAYLGCRVISFTASVLLDWTAGKTPFCFTKTAFLVGEYTARSAELVILAYVFWLCAVGK